MAVNQSSWTDPALGLLDLATFGRRWRDRASCRAVAAARCEVRVDPAFSGVHSPPPMLDPASIERLAEFPEQNDPLLNVALAEEGGGDVLLALARCSQLGAEALDIIAARVEHEGDALTA